MSEQKIYKYTLETESGGQFLEMPIGAKVLHVQSVNDTICMWVRVNSDKKETEDRCFYVVATGDVINLPSSTKFIGTAVTMNGRLACHIFAGTA